MDQMIEEALRLNIKWSLQELSRAVNGDGKTIPDPIFKVKVILDDGIQFSPSIEDVADYINTVSSNLITTVSVFPRLPEVLVNKRKGKDVKLISYNH